MDNLGTNSNLICLMKYDKELWKTAADAIKATIDTCELYGMKLTNVGDVTKNFTAAYQYLPSKGNTEIIMPYILTGVYTDYGNFVNWKPRGAPFNGYSSNLPTQNFVEMFQLKDGTYRNWDTDTITPINKPTYPYDNLDPRFKQLIAYNSEVLPELPTATLQIWDAENGNIANGGVNGKRGNAQFAHYLTKYIYGYLNNTSYTSPNQWRPFTPYMRLTEMYLNLAEALNEYYGDEDSKPVADVYARINTIRARSGMPALNESLINTKAKMRVQIQKERAIELGFEDSRFFDHAGNSASVSATNGRMPLLTLKGVSKAFGANQALSGVDFEVDAGEVVAGLDREAGRAPGRRRLRHPRGRGRLPAWSGEGDEGFRPTVGWRRAGCRDHDQRPAPSRDFMQCG